MKKEIIAKILFVLYIPIFLFGGFIFGLSMLLKIFGAWLMLAKEMARDEISAIKRSL